MQDAVFFMFYSTKKKKLQQYFSYVIVMYSAAHEIAHRQANLEEPCPFFFFKNSFLLQALGFTSGKNKMPVSNKPKLRARSLGLIGFICAKSV